MKRILNAEHLEFGGGLEVLLQASLASMSEGDTLRVSVASRATALELPGWARIGGHTAGDPVAGVDGRLAVALRHGGVRRVLSAPLPAATYPPPLRVGGELHTSDWRGATRPAPAAADPAGGLAPLGAIPEAGAPGYDWRLHRRESIWAPDVGELAEQASAEQWDASLAIPWEAVRDVPEPLERAVAQVMTYIAQNEAAALYVPSRLIAQVHPAYPEVLLWMASHIHDEARHLEVFTKRALIGGQAAYALTSTELSLHSLLDETDFSNAALLLNVLGEGTFLDLLRFVERHAPDAATAEACRLAHRDERRHVHFGVSHVSTILGDGPERARGLVAAVERRAAKLTRLSGLDPLLIEGLTILAAGSLRPAALSEGARAVRDLMTTVERNRIKRLRAAGFDQPTAVVLSELHTPNLM